MKNFIKAALVVSAFFASVSSAQAQAVKVDAAGNMGIGTAGNNLVNADGANQRLTVLNYGRFTNHADPQNSLFKSISIGYDPNDTAGNPSAFPNIFTGNRSGTSTLRFFGNDGGGFSPKLNLRLIDGDLFFGDHPGGESSPTDRASITNAGLGTFSGLQVNGNGIVNGRLGIGTAAPTAALHVNGGLRFNGIANTNGSNGTMGARMDVDFVNPNLTIANGWATGYFISPSTYGATGAFNPDNSAVPAEQKNMIGLGAFGNYGPAATALQYTWIGRNWNDAFITFHADLAEGAAATYNGISAGTTVIRGNLVVPAPTIGVSDWALSANNGSTGASVGNVAAQSVFLNEKGHLPGLPSKKEMEKQGLDVGGNQMAIMKKLEELTVYMAALQKENEELKKKVEALGAKSKQ